MTAQAYTDLLKMYMELWFQTRPKSFIKKMVFMHNNALSLEDFNKMGFNV